MTGSGVPTKPELSALSYGELNQRVHDTAMRIANDTIAGRSLDREAVEAYRALAGEQDRRTFEGAS